MSYKAEERARQLAWKRATTTLSDPARRPGRYTGGKSRDARANEHFLGDGCASENLHPAIRRETLELFSSVGIEWHDGNPSDMPSSYLMDSMVSCVNVLMPLAKNGRALAAFFQPLFPECQDACAIVGDRVVAFEWLGRSNHLEVFR